MLVVYRHYFKLTNDIMNKLLFFSLITFIYSCSGNSEAEMIQNQKDKIDINYKRLISKHDLNYDLDMTGTFEYGSIETDSKSSNVYIAEYAAVKLDSIKTLQLSHINSKYGLFFRYAEEQGWNEITKDELIKLEKSFEIPSDGFSDSDSFRHPSSPKYVNFNGFFLIYIKSSGGEPKLFLKIQYRNDEWLFIEDASLSVDGIVYDLYTYEWERDNSGGYIFEWCNLSFNRFDVLAHILSGKDVKIKFHGDQYHDIRNVTSDQKKALKDMAMVYYVLYLKDNVKFEIH